MLPRALFCGLDLLHNAHVRLPIGLLVSLPVSNETGATVLFGHVITCCTVCGTVVARENRPKFEAYLVDDGTGVVRVMNWKEGKDEDEAFLHGPAIDLADVVEVRGRIVADEYQGASRRVVHATTIAVLTGPNDETYRLIEAIAKCKEEYSKPLDPRIIEVSNVVEEAVNSKLQKLKS
jgi:hypothetical protein